MSTSVVNEIESGVKAVAAVDKLKTLYKERPKVVIAVACVIIAVIVLAYLNYKNQLPSFCKFSLSSRKEAPKKKKSATDKKLAELEDDEDSGQVDDLIDAIETKQSKNIGSAKSPE